MESDNAPNDSSGVNVGDKRCVHKAFLRAQYVGITDAEALQAFRLLSRYEGIIPALESSHALAYALKIAESAKGGTLRDGQFSGLADVLEACGELALLVNLSGRGDKDVEYVHNILGDLLYEDPM